MTSLRLLFGSTFLLCILSLASAEEVEGIVLPDKDVTVSGFVENIITSVLIEEGDFVTEGQLLAKLDNRTERLQVELWRKRLELLEVAYQSTLNLRKDNIVSEEETLNAEIERDLAQIQLDIAKSNLEDTEIRSAINGIVVEVFKEPGELVRRGENLFRIVNTETVFVQLYLPASQVTGLELQSAVEVRFPFLQDITSQTGIIDFIDPAVDPNSGFQRVRVKLKNDAETIRAGQRCRVIFP